MTTREAVIKAVAVLTTALRQENSATLTEAYQIGLSDLTADEVVRAMERALKECLKFMPTPAELRVLAGHAPRDLTTEATMAWDAVRNAMDKLDVYGNVDFGPLINAVVRNLGGWLYLCESTLAELEWRRKDFERVYRAWADKDVAMFDGSPHFGQWKNAPITQIQVPGMPARLPALEAVQTPQAKAMRDVVRELAEEKSLAGAVGSDACAPPRAPDAAPTVLPPPLRETKPKAPPMTDAEVAARKAEINAQVAARLALEAAEVRP